VHVSWTASTSANVTGYKVLWDTASHAGGATTDYANSFDAGNELAAFLIQKFDVNTTYYFAVCAYATKVGGPSTEVTFKPTTAGMHNLGIGSKRKRHK